MQEKQNKVKGLEALNEEATKIRIVSALDNLACLARAGDMDLVYRALEIGGYLNTLLSKYLAAQGDKRFVCEKHNELMLLEQPEPFCSTCHQRHVFSSHDVDEYLFKEGL